MERVARERKTSRAFLPPACLMLEKSRDRNQEKRRKTHLVCLCPNKMIFLQNNRNNGSYFGKKSKVEKRKFNIALKIGCLSLTRFKSTASKLGDKQNQNHVYWIQNILLEKKKFLIDFSTIAENLFTRGWWMNAWLDFMSMKRVREENRKKLEHLLLAYLRVNKVWIASPKAKYKLN